MNTVVDVGGGAGSLLAAILETHPGKRGVLIDQPEVQPDAARLLSARGVGDRCDFVGGSFFDPMATTGEVWAMCQVLHDWPDAECRAILSRCRERMRETDRLLVIEMLTVPGEPNPGIAVLDMMMLLYFGEARQRTVAEYSELFRATGLEYSRCGVHVQRIQHRRSATRLTERRSALNRSRPEVPDSQADCISDHTAAAYAWPGGTHSPRFNYVARTGSLSGLINLGRHTGV